MSEGCEKGLGLLGDGWRHARNNLTVAALDLPLQPSGGDVNHVQHKLRVALAENVAGDGQSNHAWQHCSVDFDSGRRAGRRRREFRVGAVEVDDANSSGATGVARGRVSSRRHSGSALCAALSHHVRDVDARERALS